MSNKTKFRKKSVDVNKAIFSVNEGWKFDAGVWTEEENQNSSFKLPEKHLIDTSAVPKNFYQSGVVGPKSLELQEVDISSTLSNKEVWSPGVSPGRYTVYNQQGVLFPSGSFYFSGGDNQDEHHRSIVLLPSPPKTGSEIFVRYLERNQKTLSLENSVIFNKVGSFSGKASNGVELDGDEPENSDTNKNEFKLEFEDSELYRNLPIKLGVNLTLLNPDNNIYKLTLPSSLCSDYKVNFSNKRIFRKELSLKTFLDNLSDPENNEDLVDGDYAIGYTNSWGEDSGVLVKIDSAHNNYGDITFKPNSNVKLVFNKNVQIARSYTTSDLYNNLSLYLPFIPCLDRSSYQHPTEISGLELDAESLTLTVDGEAWTRVADLSNADPEALVFELDPLEGIITFGDSGISINGKAPSGEIEINWTQVPIIEYTPQRSSNIFWGGVDLNPLKNTNKTGFLVLDHKIEVPYKIELYSDLPRSFTDEGDCYYGPIEVPLQSEADRGFVYAKVYGRGDPLFPLSQQQVEFLLDDDVVVLSQYQAITNSDGAAFTEVFGASNIQKLTTKSYMYKPSQSTIPNEYLNPSPGLLQQEDYGWGEITDGVNITLPEKFSGNLDDVILFIQSIPSKTPGDLLDYSGEPLSYVNYLDPYNARTRQGGLTIVWTREVDGAEELIHPVSATPHPGNPDWTVFEFPIQIPTGRLIVAYKVLLDKTVKVRAKTSNLLSNTIRISLKISDEIIGQWRLPTAESYKGSTIGGFSFISPNDFEVIEIQPSGGGVPLDFISVGADFDIIGESFPTDEDLELSVFIIKEDDGAVIAVKDISSQSTVIDSSTIRINDLPTPPVDEYNVNYWIAVGGFDSQNEFKTATQIEIREA